jgi:hypothetical protein
MAMIRRRRPTREIPFSFDSFLDVVANVVGIIIRLILITWVGAKSYTGFVLPTPPTPPPSVAVVDADTPLPEPEDPLAPELEKQKLEMALAQAQLVEQFRAWEQTQGERQLTEKEMAALTQQIRTLQEERSGLEQTAGDKGTTGKGLALSLAEIQERGKKLAAEFEALRQAPSPKKTHRYRTPVSHPLQTEEIMFEIVKGRVTLIDIAAMLDEVDRKMHDHLETLRTRWTLTDVTAPVGPFRLRYFVERDHGELLSGELPPTDRNNFSIRQTGWEVEPVVAERGETLEQAMANGSAFRKVVEALDPNQTAVTFCVYGDSFAQYRQLRDFLHDRDITVAGRPIPPGLAIRAGKDGTASRGQ